MDVMATLGLKVQRTEAPDLEQQNQNTNRVLLGEPEWRESLVNPQCMINNPGPTCNSMLLQHDNKLDDTPKEPQKNAQLRYKIMKQAQIILNLTKKHKEAVGRFEQHTANITYEFEEQKKKVSHLEFQKKKASSALEKRDAKMKEVFGDISSTMFLELEYQEELINEMTPGEGEFFQPSHNTLVDLVEIIEQWTADDKHSEMMFNLEDGPHFEQLYAELLSRFNEQSC
ncbi:uncharacterized protein N7487_004691 [Penicillium crustosum]|uniref:uncharacterized protein n=1 Tax=Penicillium crustosum TaxID=36656 RepID=UPI0023986EC8|nr:uncharacterized protein N7487_004691 [Penicillium crustosum]KAJ5410332.1 hypothetical protein N7487_004691 [Penicillium crustosum]